MGEGNALSVSRNVGIAVSLNAQAEVMAAVMQMRARKKE